MSSPHPLNQAVIAQALHDMRNGQLRRCKAMGFNDQDLAALKEPALVSVLLNAGVSWCTVKVNPDVLHRLLRQMDNVENEIAMIDRMLMLNASTEMVAGFYGLTHQEIALRRNILQLPKRKGRHPTLSEHQDAELWKCWKPEFDARQLSLDDERGLLLLTLDLAEKLGHPASVIWATSRTWIDEGLVK
ncbi:DUF2857 domain-containing protein [Pseudomonas putida]|uniref:Coproporphyrinogen III oxidase n=1 Tax=Pseudomonas putida TaxID=303 RepID=A0A177SV96_PSEPU|nr:DUF2857 domain-containing protein [Pseudomonas putida]OAI94853.1 coproporphyrinogen III oxidase [Pseudomonas putida]